MAGFLTALPDVDKWDVDSKTVFSEKEYETNSGSLVTLKSLFKELYIAYRDNLKSWWELKSLENYLLNKIVPKGLRVNIVPATRSRSAELLEIWEKEALNSSLRFLQILIEVEKKTYEVSAKNLKELVDKTLKFKGEAEFAKKETALQTSVERYYNLLKERKHNQFVRDLSEFKEKRAFNFSQENNERVVEASSSDFESSDSEQRGYRGGFSNFGRGGKRGKGRGGKKQQKWKGNYGNRNYQPNTSSSLPSSSVPPQHVPPQYGDAQGTAPSLPSASSTTFLEARGPPYNLRKPH